MSVSTISGSIGNLVTLGTGSYANQLTITASGTVHTPSFMPLGGGNYAQVALITSANTLINEGLIQAGTTGGNGFAVNGLYLAAGYTRNDGKIFGGNGYAYVGGVGVNETGGSLYNTGLISGGAAPATNAHTGAYTDYGIVLQSGMISNAGTVTGQGGAAGLSMSGGVFTNHNLILGSIFRGTFNDLDGPGAKVNGGLLINDGVITTKLGSYRIIIGPPPVPPLQDPVLEITGGTVLNMGTLLAPSPASTVSGSAHVTTVAVTLSAGTLVNSGLISGSVTISNGGSAAPQALLANFGTIDGSVAARGTEITNFGLVDGTLGFGDGSADLIIGVDSRITGSVSAVASYTTIVYGTLGPSLPTIVTISDLTTLELAAGTATGSLDMGGSFSGFNTIEFDPGATWVLGGTAAELAAGQTITGFGLGDTLVLEGFTASASTFAGGELTLTNATQSLTLDLSGSFSGLIVTDVAQGTEIAVCYLRGTPILTPEGERAIEDLCSGDAVVTKFGGVRRIKWIGVQSFAGRFLKDNFEMLPVRIKAGALGQGAPSRDLFVSPGHSLLLGGQLILAKFLVNGITVTQEEPPARVDYFNIELETHDCVLAAGIWAESYAECAVTRGMFHNAADFTKDFPGHIAPETPRLCAPRPMAGAALAGAIAPAVARAAASTRPGTLRGYIDILSAGGRAEGWAQDMANPDLPVVLDVLRDGVRVAQLLACEMRPDLRDAGIGSGKHAFAATIPGSGKIEIVRAADGAKLPLTEAALCAA